ESEREEEGREKRVRDRKRGSGVNGGDERQIHERRTDTQMTCLTCLEFDTPDTISSPAAEGLRASQHTHTHTHTYTHTHSHTHSAGWVGISSCHLLLSLPCLSP